MRLTGRSREVSEKKCVTNGCMERGGNQCAVYQEQEVQSNVLEKGPVKVAFLSLRGRDRVNRIL